MKNVLYILLYVAVFFNILSCRSTKKINKAVTRTDAMHPGNADSVSIAKAALAGLSENTSDFTTFSAKVKVDYEDSKGKQPDFNAFLRLKKDSALWASINATFLGIEAFRILVTTDSLFIINKLDKEYEAHPIQYLSDLIHIPITFPILQNIILGNPIFVGDSLLSYRETNNQQIISTLGSAFKNLITISTDHRLVHSKLDDVQIGRQRTADLSYSDYASADNYWLATNREITVSEKSKIDISLSFKQFEFNKELSLRFVVPPNYKIK